MDSSDKLGQFLGLIVKAGQMLFGYDSVKDGIKRKKVSLVVFASDFSQKSREKFLNFIDDKGIMHLDLSEKIEYIYRFTGKNCGVLGVSDFGMAVKLKELVKERYLFRGNFYNVKI